MAPDGPFCFLRQTGVLFEKVRKNRKRLKQTSIENTKKSFV